MSFGKCKKGKITSIPPYHVIMATTKGQKMLFERFNLSVVRFDVSEISFPAPSRLSSGVLKDPRNSALYFIRKISQAVSKASARKEMGNRYFYVGKKNGLSGK